MTVLFCMLKCYLNISLYLFLSKQTSSVSLQNWHLCDEKLWFYTICKLFTSSSCFPCLKIDGIPSVSTNPSTLIVMAMRTLKNKKVYQHCMCITHFCTFLCCHCTTTVCKWLISHFIVDVNKQRQIFHHECGPQDVNSGKLAYIWHFTANWNKLNKVWKKKNSFWKDVFSAVVSMLKLPNDQLSLNVVV